MSCFNDLRRSVRIFSKRNNQKAADLFPLLNGRLTLELYNTLVLGLSFFFVFLSFNTTQNFETTLNQTTGQISLGILYGCFAATNLFSGFIVRRIGNRLAMILGGCTYVFYIATNIQSPPFLPVYFTASAVIGIGASLIWTSQGSFLSRQSAPETFGFYSGLFWAMFQANGIFGNLIAQLLIGNTDNSTRFLFFLFTVISAVGVFCMFFLIYPPLPSPSRDTLPLANDLDLHNSSSHDGIYDPTRAVVSAGSVQKGEYEALVDEDDDEPPAATWEETFQLLTGTLRMLGDAEMAHLIPIMIFSGLSQSYFFGGFPPLLKKEWLGWGMMVLAFTDVLGSVAMGRLSDKVGRRLVLAIGFVFTVGGALLANFGGSENLLFLLFLAAACFGIADACFNTQIYALIRHFCDTDDKAALGFGFFRLIQAFSSAAAFFYSVPLNNVPSSFLIQTFLVVGFLCLGLIFLGYLDYFITPIDGDNSHSDHDGNDNDNNSSDSFN